jgi:hypothetical protein
MNTLIDSIKSARHSDGTMIVLMEGGVEIRFPVAHNPRLKIATDRQLNHIEISSFGLHWPDLDEDLSIRGLLAGDYGQSDSYRTTRSS